MSNLGVCPRCGEAIVNSIENHTCPDRHDPVNHPRHYTSHPSKVECIEITEWMGFNIGNAIKYLWRADEKGNAIEDLQKAAWYVNREIAKRVKMDGSAGEVGGTDACSDYPIAGSPIRRG